MSPSHRGLITLGAALVLSVVSFEAVAASTGPYTHPFFEVVSRSRSYGCVTSTASAFTGYNADGTYYNCAYFHGGIDFRLSYDPVVATRGGTVVDVEEDHPNNPGSDCPTGSPPANFIMIKHASGQYSRYLHLTTNGAEVIVGQIVSAGQRIGVSGNSGISCGAHLHYTYTSSETSVAAQYTYNPDGKWTIGTLGRIPWLGDYVGQKSGTPALGTLDVCYGQTATYWVKFKNLGGRAWPWVNDFYSRGKVALYSTTSTGKVAFASQFQASDWETSSRVTPADTASVAPDGTGTFSFGVKGGGAAGQTTTLYLNLAALGLGKDLVNYWFIYPEQVSVSIFVIPSQACP